VACLKRHKTAGEGAYRGSATGEAQWPIGPPDDRWENHHPPLSDASGQSVDVAGGMGMQNGGQQLGLQRHGTRVNMQAGNATGGRYRRPARGYGRLQARRRTWPVDWPTSRCLSCFLYRQTEAAAFALPGRCSGVTRVISAW